MKSYTPKEIEDRINSLDNKEKELFNIIIQYIAYRLVPFAYTSFSFRKIMSLRK